MPRRQANAGRFSTSGPGTSMLSLASSWRPSHRRGLKLSRSGSPFSSEAQGSLLVEASAFGACWSYESEPAAQDQT